MSALETMRRLAWRVLVAVALPPPKLELPGGDTSEWTAEDVARVQTAIRQQLLEAEAKTMLRKHD